MASSCLRIPHQPYMIPAAHVSRPASHHARMAPDPHRTRLHHPLCVHPPPMAHPAAHGPSVTRAPARPSRMIVEQTKTCNASSPSGLIQCTEIPTPPGSPSYLELLRDSVFTLAPAGDMFESYRVWEAMEAGSIPIVDILDRVYKGARWHRLIAQRTHTRKKHHHPRQPAATHPPEQLPLAA